MAEDDWGDGGEHRWATAVLDESIDPAVVATPQIDDGRVVDLRVSYLNGAALRWAAEHDLALRVGSGLSGWRHYDVLLSVLDTGSPITLEGTEVTALEPSTYVDLRASLWADRVLVSWRDATPLIAAERRRASAEARFEALLDNYPDPALIVQPERAPDGQVDDLRVHSMNRAARVWGVRQAESLRERLSANGLDWLFDRYCRALTSGDAVSVEDLDVIRSDRSRAVADLHAVPVQDGLLLIWRDATERRMAERALAASEERFRLAFHDAPVGMAIAEMSHDNLKTYLQVNNAYATMLGMSRDDLVGRRGPDLSHPEDREAEETLVAQLASGERPMFVREKRMVRADGSTVWVRVASAASVVDGEVRYAISHVEDITDRKAAEAELERRALYDPLTGLPNRLLLLDHLSLTARELARDGGVLAVLYLDLDHFKDINDTLGHAAGDDVLCEVASRISGVLRGGATAARLAGDEFVVVTRVPDELSAVRVAERLHTAIVGPIRVGLRELVVRPSIGVATTTDSWADSEELLRHADLAMYHAKHRGSEPWALYDDALHTLAIERLAIEQDLREALAEHRFRLLYQPIVDLAQGRVVGAEALLRLQDPERGRLLPASFIDVAEDSELIVPIGGWALAEATRQLSRWQTTRPDLSVSVNVSPRQVRHLAVRDQVVAAIEGSGTKPSDLHLEITERVLLDADDAMLTELRDVTSDGCGLAIDDFGTGYSSLAYLTRFPVTELKIDRTFVAGLGRDDRDTAVVEAIVGLATALGLTSVAEGVETPAQLRVLRELGCDRAQGFHLGRPVPSGRLSSALARAVDGMDPAWPPPGA